MFNVPVYTPILVVYTVGAGAYMFKKRFDHMRKHNYLPWYGGQRGDGMMCVRTRVGLLRVILLTVGSRESLVPARFWAYLNQPSWCCRILFVYG